MIRRPPRSTRTDTLFPYTTLFRSLKGREPSHNVRFRPEAGPPSSEICSASQIAHALQFRPEALFVECVLLEFAAALYPEQETLGGPMVRSEERRLGKECVSQWRSRWSTYH